MRWATFSGAIASLLLVSLLYLIHPLQIDVVTHTKDKVWMKLRGPLFLFFESTVQLLYEPIRGEKGAVSFNTNFEHQPLIVFCPTNSDCILCFYDFDVLIRLIKIDTKKPFHSFQNGSSLNSIVGASSFEVRDGTKDDWKLAIDCLEHMDSRTFERQSIPGLNVGLVSMGAYKKQLLKKVRNQADAMYQLYGGETTMPLFREEK